MDRNPSIRTLHPLPLLIVAFPSPNITRLLWRAYSDPHHASYCAEAGERKEAADDTVENSSAVHSSAAEGAKGRCVSDRTMSHLKNII